MILAGSKLSPLWWTKLLPFFFLFAAILIGYSIVIFETTVSGVAFNNPKELKLLSKLSAFIPWLLGIFLIMRFQDINARSALHLAFQGDLAGNIFLLENILLIIALCILIPKKNRTNPKKVFWGAFAMLSGLALYRFNAYITGFDPGNGWHYFPATGEVVITLGIVAVEILGYLYIVKRFPVLHLPGK